jgi:subtilisin family serine protease
MFAGLQWAAQQGAQVMSISIELDFTALVKRLVDGGLPVELATSRALEGYRANLRMFDALMAMLRSFEAFGAGTIVVGAAGNGSRRRTNPQHEIGVALPAAADGVVSVAALGESPAGFVVAPFSNTFAQISGPGMGVVSAAIGGGLASLNGTSMACPHVAGVTALWVEDVAASPLPFRTATVLARLLASARTAGLAPGVDLVDCGVGMATAP